MSRKTAVNDPIKTVRKRSTLASVAPSPVVEPSKKTVITAISSREEFHRVLELNPGLLVMKMGAPWCGPCNAIQKEVHDFFGSSPDTVICADINVDQSTDLYMYLKAKRMVNGIPTILMYQRGNTSFAPSDSVVGADKVELEKFFKRCSKTASLLR